MRTLWLVSGVLAALLLAGDLDAASGKPQKNAFQKNKVQPPPDNGKGSGTQVSAAGMVWHTDLAAALAEAKKTNRPILVLGTGSDWCGFCMRLEKGVLSDKDFKKFAAENLVLVYADKPSRKKQSAEVAKNSQEVLEKFGVRGFPTVILLSPDGAELGRKAGYGGQSAKQYVKELKGMLKK